MENVVMYLPFMQLWVSVQKPYHLYENVEGTIKMLSIDTLPLQNVIFEGTYYTGETFISLRLVTGLKFLSYKIKSISFTCTF